MKNPVGAPWVRRGGGILDAGAGLGPRNRASSGLGDLAGRFFLCPVRGVNSFYPPPRAAIRLSLSVGRGGEDSPEAARGPPLPRLLELRRSPISF